MLRLLCCALCATKHASGSSSTADRIRATRAPDPECVRWQLERTREQQPARLAVVLRGEGFRNNGERSTNETCCDGTFDAQHRVVESHLKVFDRLAAAGYSVDIYISTYACTNGRNLTGEWLPRWYARYIRAIALSDRGSSVAGQASSIARGLALVDASSTQHDHLLILRLDSSLGGLQVCVQHGVGRSSSHTFWGALPHALATREHESCADECGAVYKTLSEMTVAADRFHYVPGNLLQCLLKHRDYLSGHGWAHQYAMLSAWSGAPTTPLAGSGGGNEPRLGPSGSARSGSASHSPAAVWQSCVQPLEYEKHTGEGCDR